MAKNRDVLLNSDIDIMFANGDFVVGDSTMQNQYLILSSQKGEWTENPNIGAGIVDMLNDDDSETYWKHRITVELERDGMTVKQIQIKNSQIEINANYL